MPEEIGGVVALLLLGLWLYCIFDAITTPESEVRNLPKGMWILLVIILSDLGSLLWLFAGRPTTPKTSGMAYKGNSGAIRPPVRRSAPGRSVAPDDDPEFLSQLKKSNDDHESMLNQWEADLRRREEEMRGKPDVPPDA